MRVNVYKCRVDSTRGGLSSRADTIIVHLPEDPIPTVREGTLIMVRGNSRGTCKLVPTDYSGHTMFGGNFAYSGDSRWHAAIEQICGSRQSGAVPIHDRIEL